MITFNINQLTPAEVELLEFTITERVAPLRKAIDLPPKLYGLNDVQAAFRDMKGEGGSPDGIPMGVLLRAIELLELRKTNPEASWDETGRSPLLAEVDGQVVDERGESAEATSWPSPTATTPS